jgi:hypothetical protein
MKETKPKNEYVNESALEQITNMNVQQATDRKYHLATTLGAMFVYTVAKILSPELELTPELLTSEGYLNAATGGYVLGGVMKYISQLIK